MNILFISKDLAGSDLCYRLKNEGNNLRLFIDDENQRQNLEGMVTKTINWRNDLDWVGKDGLIIFDSIGYGKEQDDLRNKGFSVVGGCELNDKLEHDRQYGQKIFSVCDIPIVSSQNFVNIEDAINFVKSNKGMWVIKQNGHTNKNFNYVGMMEDGSDVINTLESYKRNDCKELNSIDLQKKIEGIEIGVARYFNGKKWVGPIELNMEHKSLFNGDMGPKTDEMGTLMWLDDNENNKLFQKTLAKLEKYLKSINFKGDIDINCIVNDDVVFPLEVTTRFGCPSTQLQSELFISPWTDFLKALADGNDYDLKYKKGFGIIVLIATPPFPYECGNDKYSPRGVEIFFKKNFKKDDIKNLHFEEVSMTQLDNVQRYYISSEGGYIVHVSAEAKNVIAARKKVKKIIQNIVIPKMFYRTDIGEKFIKSERKKLEAWGWI